MSYIISGLLLAMAVVMLIIVIGKIIQFSILYNVISADRSRLDRSVELHTNAF